MNTYISLLRGINVGGQRKIRMAELKSMFESMGLADVVTYVQSGNVVFRSESQNADKLAGAIEQQIEQTFGHDVSVLIRDDRDFKQIIENNPFLTGGRDEDPTKLHVTFLYRDPSEEKIRSLDIPNAGSDEYETRGREIFIFCPNGYGRSKLTNQVFERKLDIPASTRNWKTANALYKLASEK